MLATTISDHSKTGDKLHDDTTEAHCTSTPHAQHEHAEHEHTPHKCRAEGPHSARAHTSGPRKPSPGTEWGHTQRTQTEHKHAQR